MITDPCQCGLQPEVKEIKSVIYVCMCGCGKHSTPMQLREWAIKEWNQLQADLAKQPAKEKAA